MAIRQCQLASGKNSVLVLGDSRIAEGFSAPIAGAETANGVHFINGAVPGSTPRCWYYLLREMDPQSSRFRLIVLPVDDYDDEDGAWDWADRDLDLRIVIFSLRLQDAMDFPLSFHDSSARFDALRSTLFKGFVAKEDLQGFLLHPVQRLQKTRQFHDSGIDWLNGYGGNPGSMWDLPQVNQRKTLPQTGNYARYRSLWFGKILAKYRGTATRLLIIRVPRGPFPINHAPGQFSHAVRDLNAPELTLADENAFSSLERPEYFFDDLHLNATGRQAFSKLLARIVSG